MAEKTIADQADQVKPAGQEPTRANEQYVAPPVDIYETEEALIVCADLPGVTADGLRIEVKDRVLTIVGRASIEPLGRALVTEFELRTFFREFEVSDRVDTEQIRADLRNGVLTLTLPKAPKALPRQITVQAG